MRIGIATAWGALRTWTCSGHMHENPDLSLLHVLESLAGLPFDVSFVRLDDIAAHGVPQVDVLVNAGPIGSAWSGGVEWDDPRLVAAITRFVAQGGGLIGVQQPSALDRGLSRFQLAQVFGVDQDSGDRHVQARRTFTLRDDHPILASGADLTGLDSMPELMVLRDDVEVLAETSGTPLLTATQFGAGRAVYAANHRHTAGAARRLANAVTWASGRRAKGWVTTNPATSVAVFDDVMVVTNDTLEPQTTTVGDEKHTSTVLSLEPGALVTLDARSHAIVAAKDLARATV